MIRRLLQHRQHMQDPQRRFANRHALQRFANRCFEWRYAMTAFVIVVTLFTFHFALSTPSAFAAAGINGAINYQGKLSAVSGVSITNGQYNMRFKIFSAASGGVPLWTETWNASTQRITSTGGLFSIALGTHVTMTGSVDFNSDSLYLQVEFDPGNDDVYEEVFTPRRRFASVPYAHNANTLDGLDSTQFIRSDQSYTASGTITIRPRDAAKIGIDIVATGGSSATGALRLSTQGGPAIVFGSGGVSYDTNLYRVSANTLKTDDALQVVGTISGSRLNISGNSHLSGALLVKGNVGIGTTSPLRTLHVAGSVELDTNNGLYFRRSVGIAEYGSITHDGADFTIAAGEWSGTDITFTGQGELKSAFTTFRGTSAGGLDFIAELSGGSDMTFTSNNGMTFDTGYGGGVGLYNFKIAGTSIAYMNAAGNVGINTTTPRAKLEVAGSMSGMTLFVQQFSGAGLVNCDAATQTLKWNATTEKFSCGTSSAISTGAVLAIGDARYVKKSGDTMTGALVLSPLSGSGVTALRIVGKMTLTGSAVLQSSAAGTVALTVKGAVGQTANLQEWQNSAGTVLVKVDSAGNITAPGLELTGVNSIVMPNNGAIVGGGVVSFNIGDSNDTVGIGAVNFYINSPTILRNILSNDSAAYLQINGGTSGYTYFNGLVGIGTSTPRAKLEVAGSISGATLFAQTISGAGLVNCDAATQTLKWNATTEKFSCGTGGGFSTGAVLAIGDARYVKKAGDTMTGALVLDITGGNFNTVGLKVINTLSGAHLHAERTLSSSGKLIVEDGIVTGPPSNSTVALKVYGATDGTNIAEWYGSAGSLVAYMQNSGQFYASTIIGINGTSVIDSSFNISARSNGNFYASQNTQLKWTNFNDSYQDWDSGLGRHSAGIVKVTDGSTGIGSLYVSTLSGARLKAQNSIASSGSLIVEGAMSGASLYVATSINGAGLTDCDAANQTLAWDSTTGRFSCGTDADTDTTYTAGQGLTLNGTAFRLSDAFSGTSLSIYGTLSGSNLTVSRSASISGTLIVKTGITSKGSVSGATIDGFGLGSCNGDSQKLLYNSTTDTFECGTISASSTFGTGNVLTIGDARYLKRSGGTMTGTLVIDITGGNFNTIGLKVLNTLSGGHLHAERTLSSSGTLVVEGATTLNSTAALNGAVTLGSTLSQSIPGYSNTLVLGSNPTFASHSLIIGNNASANFGGSIALGHSATTTAANQMVIGAYGTSINTLYIGNGATANNEEVDFALYGGSISNSAAAGGDFTLGAGYNTVGGGGGSLIFKTGDASLSERMRILSNGNVGIGTTTPRAKLEVAGSISGATLFAQTISGAGLVNCDAATQTLKWNATTEKFSCGTSSAISTGAVLTIGDARYLKRSGGTMTGQLVVDITGGDFNTVGLKVLNTLSGAHLHAERLLTASGFIIGESGALLDGGTFYVDAGNNRVGIGTTSPATPFHIMDQLSQMRLGYDISNYAGFTVASNGNLTIAQSNNTDGVTTITSKQVNIGPFAPVNIGESGSGYPGVGYNVNFSTIGNTYTYKGNDTAYLMDLGTSAGNRIGFKVATAGTAGNTISFTEALSVLNSGNVGIGTTTPRAKLEVAGSISGATLFAQTISGAGLVNCDAATQTLKWNATTEKFSCGTSSAISTGAVLAIGDARYVKKSGDTMTGALIVKANLSGSRLIISENANISGALLVNGNVGIGTTSPTTAFHVKTSAIYASPLRILDMSGVSGSASNGAGLQISNYADSVSYYMYTDNSGEFNIRSSGGVDIFESTSGYVSINNTYGTSLSANILNVALSTSSITRLLINSSGDVGIGTTSPRALLEVAGSISGATLFAQTISGAGLVNCDAATQTLKWNATTEKFSCGTSSAISTGAVLAIGDARYLKRSGGTMTGQLVVDITGGNFNTVGLKVLNTLSGAHLHAERLLSSSGALRVEGTGDSYIMGNVGIGTASPNDKLEVNGALRITRAQGGSDLRIVPEASGEPIFGVYYGATRSFGVRSNGILHFDQGLYNGILDIGNVANQNRITRSNSFNIDFSDGSNQFVFQSGHSSESAGRAAFVFDTENALSTSHIFDLREDGTSVMTVNHAGNVGIGTTTPRAKLEVAGSISGATLFAQTISGAGLVNCDAATQTLKWNATTEKFSCGTSSAISTGAVLTIGDARYVKKAGDTMTGALIVKANLSGSRLIISENANISGALLVKGNVGIGTTTPSVALEVAGQIVDRGNVWTARSAAEANLWFSVTYGNGLFVAVATTGTNQVMTSPDGITWTARSAAEGNPWHSVTYGNGLFVAVANDGTNRVMTSPDGITWTARSAAEANGWFSVTYGNGLFVAVATTGTNRIMTSPDGITWTARSAAEANSWRSITYGNGLFVAVANDGTNRVMTSSDGITWTARSATEANAWYSVTYGNGLFVAVATTGTNRVMTSPDGITWTARSAAEANGWHSVTYGNGLFVAVAMTGTNRVMTSPDGITWTARSATETNSWRSITYGNGLFVAVANDGTNQVMTSGKTEITALVHNNTYQGGMQIMGNVGIGTTTPRAKLEVAGSISGATLFAQTISGAGLVNCDAATQTLKWNATTEKFSCGTGGGFSTGAVLAIGDARYVKKAGDTMTGSLTVSGSSVGIRISAISSPYLELYRPGQSHWNLQHTNNGFAIQNNWSGVGYNSVITMSDGLGISTTPTMSLVYNGDGNRVGIGNTTPDTALDVVGTISGSLITQNGGSANNYFMGRLGIGTTTPRAKLEVAGSISGATLFAQTISGAGLVNCDAATQTLKWNATTEKFSCGTGGGFSTGAVLTIGDARYLKRSGGTMTGQLIVDITGGNFNTVGFKVLNTLSGAHLHAERLLTASGFIIGESGALLDGGTFYVDAGNNRVGVGTTTPAATFHVFGNGTSNSGIRSDAIRGIVSDENNGSVGGYFDAGTANSAYALMTGQGPVNFGYTGTSNMTLNGWLSATTAASSTNGNLFLGDSTNFNAADITGGQIVFAGDDVIQNTTRATFAMIRGMKENETYNNSLGALIFGTQSTSAGASGLSTVTEKMRILSTGNVGINTTTPRAKLEVAGSISGATLFAQTISGAGLVNCDAATHTLKWNATTEKFSCGTSSAISTGAVLAIGDARYVKKAGDTMTGALVINITGGNINTIGLKIINTLSGAHLHAERLLTSSGRAVIELSDPAQIGLTVRAAASQSANLQEWQNSAGTALAVIRSDGNIGIGADATNPNKPLLMIKSGADAGDNYAAMEIRTSGVSGYGTAIYLNSSSMTGGRNWIMYSGGTSDGAGAGKFSIYDVTGGGDRLTIDSSGLVGIGTTTPRAKLEVAGSISGATLFAQTISGAGLVNCDAATQTLKWNATTEKFSCGTSSAISTGAVLAIGDARYVKKSGDTMTGTLILNPESGLALNARGTISGALITQNGAGNNYFMGNVGIGTTAPGAKLDVRTTGSTTGLDIHVPDSNPYAMRIFNDTFSPSSPSFTAYSSNDGAFSMGTTANANLSIYTNNAARMVYANDGRVAVGTATALNPNSHLNIWDGVATNTQLIVDGASGQTADIMKVTSASGGGLVFDANRMLKVARSTNNSATAPMTISVANTYLGLGGAEYSVDSYRLIGFGYVGASSYPAYIGYQEKTDAGYTNGDLIFGTRSLTSDTTPTERVRITSTGNVGINTTTPSAKLEVAGSISGATLFAQTISGAGLVNCDAATQTLKWNATTEKFSCGTSSAISTGAVLTIGDARYVKKSGDTMTGALVLTPTAGSGVTALRIVGKMTLTGSAVLQSSAAGTVALTVKGAVGQTANLQEWQNSAGTVLASVGPVVAFTIRGAVDSATSFSIKRQGDNSEVFAVNDSGTFGIKDGERFYLDGTSGDRITYIQENGGINFVGGAGRNITFNSSGYDAFLAGGTEAMRIISSGNVGIGTTTPRAKLEVAGSISGATLFAQTISGAGLVNCDAATQTLKWNATTEKFSCGTSSAINTGAVLTIGDARYLKRSGGTMTGQLVVDITGGNFNTIGLKVINTLSGAHLHAERLLSSSGALRVEGTGDSYIMGNVGIGTTSPETALEVAGTMSGRQVYASDSFRMHTSATNSEIFTVRDATNATNRFQIKLTGANGAALGVGATDFITINYETVNVLVKANAYNRIPFVVRGADSQTSNLTEWQNSSSVPLTVISEAGYLGINTTTPRAKLEVAGSISGATLFAQTISGAGLVNCDAATQTLKWNATTEKFSCGTSSAISTGAVLAIGDARYLKRSGGTMTGQLVVDITGGNFNTVGLKVLNTLSGAHLHAEKLLTSSGMIIGESGALLDGGTFYVDAGNNKVGIGTMSPGAKLDVAGFIRSGEEPSGYSGIEFTNESAAVKWQVLKNSNDSFGIWGNGGSSQYFSILDTSGNVGIGTSTPRAKLEVAGSISGATLFVQSMSGAGLTDCDAASQVLKWDATNEVFSCGTATSSSFGTGNVLTIGDARYLKRSGGTMTGQLIVDITGGNFNTVGLKVINTLSGAHLHAERTLSSSGKLIVEDGIVTGPPSNSTVALKVYGATDGTNIAEWYGSAGSLVAYMQNSGQFYASTIIGINGTSVIDSSFNINARSNGNFYASQNTQLKWTNFNDSYQDWDSGLGRHSAGIVKVTDGSTGIGSLYVSTLSGARLKAQNSIASSGSLIVEGAMSGASLYIATSIQGAGLTDCDAATQTLAWDAVTGRFSCGTDADTDTTYTAGQGLTLNGTAFRLSDAFSGTSLSIYGTLSGTNLTVSRSASISGTLIVKTGITSKGSVSGSTIDGFGLGSCNGASQKLLYNSTTDKFECGTISASSSSFGTGNVLTIGDARYLKRSGGTMTGQLVVDITGGNFNTVGLKVINTLSGAHLHAEKLLTSSGMIIGESGALLDGGTFYVDAGNNRVGIGITSPAALLHVSGSLLLPSSTVLSEDFETSSALTGGSRSTAQAHGGSYSLLFSTSGAGSKVSKSITIGAQGGTITYWVFDEDDYGTTYFRINGTNEHTIDGVYQTWTQKTANLPAGTYTIDWYTTDGDPEGSNKMYLDDIVIVNNAGGSDIISAVFDGMVGIGTTSPTSALQVEGNAVFNDNGNDFDFRIEGSTDASAFFVHGETSHVGIGTTEPKAKLDVVGTISGSRLSISNNANISGALLTIGNITTLGTLSGYNLTVSRSASISGTLIVKTGITSKGSVSGSTIDGFGLGSCNGGSSKLLYNSTTDKFECGTISASSSSFGTGNVLTIGDARYVRKSGDTMTGSLLVQGTLSGRHLIVSQTASFSGALRVVNTARFSSGAVFDTNTLYIDAFNNRVGIGTTAPKAQLDVVGTISGSRLVISQNGAFSGSVVVKNTLSGSSLIGFGLGDCSASDKKLIYNNSTGKFSCATDQTSAGGGLTFSTAEGIYVNQSGDTMTGALTINVTNGNLDTIGLKVINTLSGAHLHAERTLTTSGSLAVEGITYLQGQILAANGTAAAPAYSFAAGSNFGLGFQTGQLDFVANGAVQWSLTGTPQLYFKSVAGGTGGAPLITNAAGDTGIYFPATGVLGISANSAENGRFLSSGWQTSYGSADAVSYAINSRKARGTVASPTAITTGDDLLTISGLGYVGATGTYVESARILFDSEGVVSDTTSGIGGALSFQTRPSAGTLTERMRITGSGSIGIGTIAPETTLEIIGTASGRDLYATQSISGTHLYSAQTFGGAGLADCDTAGTSKLLWDSTTKRFSCGTDQTGGSSTFGTGNVLTIGDSRYLKRSGGTMTGQLVVDITGGNLNTIGLKIIHTLSGAHLHAEKLLTASGFVIGESGALLDAGTFYVDAGNNRVGIGTTSPTQALDVVGTVNASTAYRLNTNTILNYSGTVPRLGDSGGWSAVAIYGGSSEVMRVTDGGLVGIGTTTPKTKLEVIGTISGSQVHAGQILTSSGLLMVTQKQKRGSGALVVDQRTNSTGAYLTATGSRAPVLVLNKSGFQNTHSPHILFGYNGTFDLSMRRSEASTLAISGSVIIDRTLTVQVYGAATATTVCRTSTGMLAACSSSLRYKEDVQDLSMGLDTIRRMRAVDFKWQGRDERDFGFIAEEMEQINPLLVEYDNQGRVQGVKYMQLTAVLANAVKALDVRLLGITNDSGTVLHARDLITSSGSLRVVGLGTFGSGILLGTSYTDGSADVLTVTSNVGGTGNTVFRVTADGNVYTDGTFNSAGADYAEWFRESEKWKGDPPSPAGYGGARSGKLQPGEVVCIDVLQANTVRRCERGGDPNVMGIVSTNPAFIGNAIGGAEGTQDTPGHVLVGLIGQVPATVNLDGGEIRPGDSLTSSKRPGEARRALAGESTVGVALEPYNGNGNNKINVLISRRNQSLTVETVEQKVLDSIAQMNLSDEIELMVQSVSDTLDLDDRVRFALDNQLIALDLASKVNTLVDRHLSGAVLAFDQSDFSLEIAEFGSGFILLNNRISALESRMTALEQRTFSGTSLHAAAGSFSGSLTVGSGFTLVSGDARLGVFSVRGTEVSIGSLMSTGSLKLIGNITVEGLAMFLGNVRITGELILSSKQAGFAVIPATGTSVTVRWNDPMTGTPVVTATPDVPVLFAVSKVSATGFTIRIAGTATENITFAYIALSADMPTTLMGTGAVADGALVPFHIDPQGRPFSLTNSVWNQCIADPYALDICNGFHQGTLWFAHPDIAAADGKVKSFTYDPTRNPALVLPPEYVRTVVGGEVAEVTDVPEVTEEPDTSTGSTTEPQPQPEPKPQPAPEAGTGTTTEPEPEPEPELPVPEPPLPPISSSDSDEEEVPAGESAAPAPAPTE